MMNKVVHFEIPTDDTGRAQKFYQQAFGWQTKDMPEMKYVLAYTTEVDDKMMPKEAGAINGGLMMRNDTVKTLSLSIDVPNLEEAMDKVKLAGGMIVMDKMAVGDMGFMAYFKDTEGNILSLWQNA